MQQNTFPTYLLINIVYCKKKNRIYVQLMDLTGTLIQELNKRNLLEHNMKKLYDIEIIKK